MIWVEWNELRVLNTPPALFKRLNSSTDIKYNGWRWLVSIVQVDVVSFSFSELRSQANDLVTFIAIQSFHQLKTKFTFNVFVIQYIFLYTIISIASFRVLLNTSEFRKRININQCQRMSSFNLNKKNLKKYKHLDFTAFKNEFSKNNCFK